MNYSSKPRLAWPDDKLYFITLSTFLHYPYFRFDNQKMLVLNKLKSIEEKLAIKFKAFSIAMNHVHVFTWLEKGETFSRLMQLLKGGLSHEYNKKFPDKQYDELWGDRKALIVHDEEGYYRVLGYIIGNLLKHKEVNNFHELYECPFANYKEIADGNCEEFAKNLVYKVIAIEEDDKGIVDFEGLKKVDIKDILGGK